MGGWWRAGVGVCVCVGGGGGVLANCGLTHAQADCKSCCLH